jgi:hypothetical protein
MGRIVLGIVAGVLTVILAVGTLELAAHLVFPVRSDSAPMPAAVQLLVLAAYFLGAFLGALVAVRISRRTWTAWAIAAVVAGGAIWSMFVVPHPQWLQVAAVIVPFLGAVAARHVPVRAVAA